jgi:hypothetical protein
MRVLLFGLLCTLLVLSACGNNGDGVAAPNSELTIESVPGLAVISSPADRGAITMTLGQQRTLRINRTTRSTGIPDVETDVTADADFNFTDPDVAAINVNGQLTALASGFTVMEVVYRDGDNDPSDDDKVYLDITVLP